MLAMEHEPTVAAVTSAVCTLFVTADSSERLAADKWLRDLRKQSGEAMWPICRAIVQGDAAAAAVWQGDAGLAAAVRTFAAQAIREHGQKTRLPAGGDPSPFVAEVLGLCAAEAASLLAAGGGPQAASRAVLTQLCLAAAAAGIRALGWPAEETLDRLCGLLQGGGRAETAALLELLRQLPEELTEKRLSTAPAQRKAVQAALEQAAGAVSESLASLVGPDGSGAGPVLAAWGGWLDAGLLPVAVVAGSPLLGMAIHSLAGGAGRWPAAAAVAADVVCTASAMVVAGAGPPRPTAELVQAAELLLPVLLEAAPELCGALAAGQGGQEVARVLVAVGVAAAAAAPGSVWMGDGGLAAGGGAAGAACRSVVDCLTALMIGGEPDAAAITLDFWTALGAAAVR